MGSVRFNLQGEAWFIDYIDATSAAESIERLLNGQH